MGEQEELERTVVVKILGDASESFQALFDRERHALGRLSQNPGIITVYQSGIVDERPYLVLHYADEGTLADRFSSGAATSSNARELLFSLAKAVALIHRADLVHGDIKPSNVLLDSRAGVLLADFGLAEFSASSPSSGYTLAYAAPERLRGGPAIQGSRHVLPWGPGVPAPGW